MDLGLVHAPDMAAASQTRTLSTPGRRANPAHSEGPAATQNGEDLGLGESQIQAAFQKESGDWKIAPVPDTQGCQVFLAS